MSVTVKYKNANLTTISNGATKTLNTSGKYMEDNVQIVDTTASMTLPTSAASSATSGFTSKATIGRSTSAQYINIPTGYNGTGAYYTISAVANGTAGTPTASKGTVSGNAVSVTPSVTNTTGYITGGTKTGTAVSVAASELVSGTLSITANGTTGVTNYANVNVNVQPAIGKKTYSSSGSPERSFTVADVPREPYYVVVAGGSSSGTLSNVSNYSYIISLICGVRSGNSDYGRCYGRRLDPESGSRYTINSSIITVSSSISYSYSGTTLTISTSSSGNGFYGSYTIIYVY